MVKLKRLTKGDVYRFKEKVKIVKVLRSTVRVKELEEGEVFEMDKVEFRGMYELEN